MKNKLEVLKFWLVVIYAYIFRYGSRHKVVRGYNEAMWVSKIFKRPSGYRVMVLKFKNRDEQTRLLKVFYRNSNIYTLKFVR